MRDYPLVSLIIISYNQQKYIPDCMKSLLGLTYPNIELLYLDDCSPDGSYEVASRYLEDLQKKYETVRFVDNRENKGLINNLNRLVSESNGKYIKFMAADDFLTEDSIELMVYYMENHSKCDILYTNGIYGDDSIHYPIEEGNTLIKLYHGAQLEGEGLLEEMYRKDFIAAPTVMVRGDVYSRCGLYDGRIGIEDWDFYIRIAEHGCIGYLDEVTVMYRFTDNSLSHSANPVRRMNMQKSTLLIREKYKDKVLGSQILIEKSYNEAYQDATHIGDKEYFMFLHDYAVRNRVRISWKNRMRYLLYKMHVFQILKS